MRTFLALALTFSSVSLLGQQTTTTATATATSGATTTVAAPTVTGDDELASAERTRERFRHLVSQHSSEVGKEIGLDPALLSNDQFLSRYPELAQFLTQHPEIRRNPHYYVVGFYEPTTYRRNPWESALEAISIAFVMGFIAFMLSWLVRTVVEQRRWSRLAQTQAEVHKRIMDRFGTSEELIAYMKTPAGARFLESAPIPLHGDSPTPKTPMTRVLWSIQIGTVVAAAGVGMLGVSARFTGDSQQGFFAMGAIALSIGIGFILSAIVSLILARRLGVWQDGLPAKTFDSETGLVR